MKKVIKIVAAGLGGILACLSAVYFIRMEKVHKVAKEIEESL